jgi:hypothetical protein
MTTPIPLIELVGIAALFLFENPRACGQAEVDPDHYETTTLNARPAKTSAATQPKGLHQGRNFTLRHRDIREGSDLQSPAQQVFRDSEGKTVQVTLNRKKPSCGSPTQTSLISN